MRWTVTQIAELSIKLYISSQEVSLERMKKI